MASRRNGTIYAGVTADLIAHASQHRAGSASAFTRKHGVTRLVWFELLETMEEAISREKAIKEWRRAWKIELIAVSNPHWLDLYLSLL